MHNFDDYESLAEKYENETIEFARQNPHINEGMLVRIYDMYTGCDVIGYGIVARNSMRWSSFFCQYIADVMTINGLLPNVIAGRLEREVCGRVRGVV